MYLELAPCETPYYVIPILSTEATASSSSANNSNNKGFVLGLIAERPVDGVSRKVQFKSLPAACPVFRGLSNYFSTKHEMREVSAYFQQKPPVGCPSRLLSSLSGKSILVPGAGYATTRSQH